MWQVLHFIIPQESIGRYVRILLQFFSSSRIYWWLFIIAFSRFNEPGEMNDGPLCRCSLKSKKSGIRHGIYPGEEHLTPCNIGSNSADKLYHYRITISPPTNFLIKTPTIIHHDEHEFIFEGFSMFSHHPLEKLPNCKVHKIYFVFNVRNSRRYKK